MLWTDVVLSQNDDDLLLLDPEIGYFMSCHAFVRVLIVFLKQVKNISSKKSHTAVKYYELNPMPVHNEEKLYDTVL